MMSSTNEEDPFLQVQQDVQSQLSTARSLFTSYLRIRSLVAPTSSSSPELASARSDLESALSDLSEDLADLDASVRAAEPDPARFGLAPAEVARRRRFVNEVGGEVADMREELTKSPSSAAGRRGAGGAAAAGRSDLPDPSSFALPGDDGRSGGNKGNNNNNNGVDYAAEFEHQQQLLMMREQDQQLDGVAQTVVTLRRQADDMGRELEEQMEMLGVVDELTTRVGDRLQTGMEKLKYVMRRNEDRLSSCCIGVLIVVLMILLILLLIL
ncbi:hypothetical protein VTJ83DRAFT_1889 [Remersonia thermophila]|uniref:t-SNARE coiled-coil homology domain-containing protein n=1 Tax=Remersonia thermophila TaxID=72144 RepID=A0ABR4DH61_9PEZI